MKWEGSKDAGRKDQRMGVRRIKKWNEGSNCAGRKDQRMMDLHFSGPHPSPSKVWRLSQNWKFPSTIMNFTNNLVCL